MLSQGLGYKALEGAVKKVPGAGALMGLEVSRLEREEGSLIP